MVRAEWTYVGGIYSIEVSWVDPAILWVSDASLSFAQGRRMSQFSDLRLISGGFFFTSSTQLIGLSRVASVNFFVDSIFICRLHPSHLLFLRWRLQIQPPARLFEG